LLASPGKSPRRLCCGKKADSASTNSGNYIDDSHKKTKKFKSCVCRIPRRSKIERRLMDFFSMDTKEYVEPIETGVYARSIRREGDWIIGEMSDGTTAFSLPRDETKEAKIGPRNQSVVDNP
jgi:hypothetical protein